MKGRCITMTIEIYLLDRSKHTAGRIGVADYDEGVMEILQYLIDGMGNLDDVGLYSPDNDRWFNTAKVAQVTGIRKRTFDERLNNVPTWRLPVPA